MNDMMLKDSELFLKWLLKMSMCIIKEVCRDSFHSRRLSKLLRITDIPVGLSPLQTRPGKEGR